ncbi:glycosyltransferase [Leptolyngbyaceae cyanobacterium CCMR0082]|uniref:Glycosyltransferase n=2 Tax=Adonisia turfae TaxID=2950184 RepID=A0A6M0SC35_9CYAN|nr:hormogonium polysaccharide biosynthesis glycosyltransferase HpsE [Adonisia turfae]MDV3352892.1 hormogonium polysaccharide biosynthesis glycosyltransferase HpsE [Leptothoe sp. LEGE 181152]NEZ56423.1 glycosyltransferase [Adonisia turfae CCMR0081]NEZ66038.1 glycosyltransferase [Adonisia turfae CCMR0082]
MSHSVVLSSPLTETVQRPCDFTIAICTYNGAQRIPAVLDRLQQQLNTQILRWEVFVIDNNSSDSTAAVVQEYQQKWSSDIPLRYLFEGRQGAAYARQLAMETAKSELVGFLDDDNLPADNWVATAYKFGQQHPHVGAYGSQIYGQFEGTLPDDFHRIQSFFALTQRGDEAHVYQPRQRVLPPSAGLVVRRQAWLKNVPRQLILTGRHDEQMLTGEDLEAIAHIRRGNWEIWHNPDMKVWHQIPARRLQRSYLLPFFRGIGLSRHVTRMLNMPSWQRPFMFWVFIASDLLKALHHVVTYRTLLQTKVVPACELEFYLCSLVSPLYIWRLLLLRFLKNKS